MTDAAPRHDQRRPADLRTVRIIRGFTRMAHGSVLMEFGRTRVICTAMISNGTPPFRAGSGQGWVTAEYAMLPGSTPVRKERKTDGRATEIQRLIGRALRAVVNFDRMAETSVYVDCDVLEADGGTRTAAITGGYVALADALAYGLRRGIIPARSPAIMARQAPDAPPPPPSKLADLLPDSVAAVSVGIVNGRPVLDLDYPEDSAAEVDMNVAMTGSGQLIEIQGTGERRTFSEAELRAMLDLARLGCGQLTELQKQALAAPLESGTPIVTEIRR